jgi:hypothetical protein
MSKPTEDDFWSENRTPVFYEGFNGDVTRSPCAVGAASCIHPGFEVPFRWL